MTRPPPLTIESADEADRPVLERLWTMFRHDMSSFSGALPDADGRFRQERLDLALSRDDWRACLIRLGPSPVGFCLVRGLQGPERVVTSFFVVRAARRAGVGRAAARAVTGQDPGRWAVAFQDVNAPAVAFWRSIAAEADPGWTLERVAVPERPDLPPDSWVRFSVTGRVADHG